MENSNGNEITLPRDLPFAPFSIPTDVPPPGPGESWLDFLTEPIETL